MAPGGLMALDERMRTSVRTTMGDRKATGGGMGRGYAPGPIPPRRQAATAPAPRPACASARHRAAPARTQSRWPDAPLDPSPLPRTAPPPHAPESPDALGAAGGAARTTGSSALSSGLHRRTACAQPA